MKVPRLDLRVEDAPIAGRIREAIERVIQSGAFIDGPDVHALERELNHYADHGSARTVPNSMVTCASGTDALTLACRAAALEADDTVVVPALSFSASASAVLRAGLKLRFVDIDPTTFLIDWEQAQDAIYEHHGSLVMPVHLYGRVAVPPSSWPLAHVLVADACQAFGAPGVTHATPFAAFSFFPSKPLGCYGDGGAVMCPATCVNAVRTLAHHGARRKYVSEVVGFNSRLDSIQAAILLVKLERVEALRRARSLIAQTYAERLGDLEWIRLPELVSDHGWHCYVIRVQRDRDAFLQHLQKDGIDAVVQYPVPLPHQRAFACKGAFPHAENACREIVGLPIWSGMSDAQIEAVITSVRSF